jgi:hypothetical protein
MDEQRDAKPAPTANERQIPKESLEGPAPTTEGSILVDSVIRVVLIQ